MRGIEIDKKLIRGQTRNSGKALLGPLLQQEGMKTSNRFPHSLHKGGGADSLYGVRVGARVGLGPEVMPEEWLRWSAHPFGGAVCKVHG